MEAIGYISYWGFTPAIDFFKGTDIDLNKDDRDIFILLTECSDVRHILKSIADLLPLKAKREHKINIFIHEK